MKLCEHGPYKVRPLPGYVCGRCGRFLVGPPKPNRNVQVRQTPRQASPRRRARGLVGYGGADRAARTLRAMKRRVRAQHEPNEREQLHAARVAFGEQQLAKLISTQEVKLRARRRHRRRHRGKRR